MLIIQLISIFLELATQKFQDDEMNIQSNCKTRQKN